MNKVSFIPYTLFFKFDAGTSRGVLREKRTWFIKIENEKKVVGIGECGPLKGLSPDDREDFEIWLANFCNQFQNINIPETEEAIFAVIAEIVPAEFPSIRFGFETAFLDLLHNGQRTIFDNSFKRHTQIPINGLVWMGDKEFMLEQVDKKLEEGYRCIKIKIGAIEFSKECEIIEYIRSRFGKEELTIRVDANGAFTLEEAKAKLKVLSDFQIHSIEQPLPTGKPLEMAELVEMKILPIALDEELIGVYTKQEKIQVLDSINPPYIILKPTLHGGLFSCKEWIDLADERRMGWWITSALESNIGLNAIAQFTAEYSVTIPQGLGTGQLYTNNIESPLEIENGYLRYNNLKIFELGELFHNSYSR
jgi:o-succinylbenzoate synthase